MTRLIPGQSVVLTTGAFATVVDFPTEEAVRVRYATGDTNIYYGFEVKTRAEALRHWHHMTTMLARQLGDLDLMDACEQSAAFVERAAQQCDAADAVKGLAS